MKNLLQNKTDDGKERMRLDEALAEYKQRIECV